VAKASGDALAYQLGKLPGGLDGSLSPGLDDPAGDPPAEPLFPVVKEHLSQLIGREAAQQFGGCGPGRGRARFRAPFRVEPHVERSLGGEAEPAVRPGKLVGREPQVQKHALDQRDAQLIQHLAHRTIGRVNQRHGQTSGGFLGQGQHGRVAVQSDDPTGRADVPCQGCCMAPCAHGPVHQDRSVMGLQPANHLVEQDGAMHVSTRFRRSKSREHVVARNHVRQERR
jgi:hypothetical protein